MPDDGDDRATVDELLRDLARSDAVAGVVGEQRSGDGGPDHSGLALISSTASSMPFRLALPYASLHGPAAPNVTDCALAPAQAVSARRRSDRAGERTSSGGASGEGPERRRSGRYKDDTRAGGVTPYKDCGRGPERRRGCLQRLPEARVTSAVGVRSVCRSCDRLRQCVPIRRANSSPRHGRYSETQRVPTTDAAPELATPHLADGGLLMNRSRSIGLLAVATLFAACSENSTAPQSPASESTTFEYGGGATADLSAKDTLKFSITIDPSRPTYYDLGSGNSITFPAGSLCDPNKSSYGDRRMGQALHRRQEPAHHHGDGVAGFARPPARRLQPNVRFAPSWDSRQWVKITFSDLQASLDLSFNILYCPTLALAVQGRVEDRSVRSSRTAIRSRTSSRAASSTSAATTWRRVTTSPSDDSRWGASLHVQSPFRAVAQSCRRVRPICARSSRCRSATRPKNGRALTDAVRATRKLSGYILASG